ncbi:MAG TPA: RNA methyltransferase [Thermoanaerobaculia bacterium]|nr:RNA methyltransferase [Thermoanaerobaculia bacterium]
MTTRTTLPPAVILVEPQLGENIGACARAMLNCGLEDLRLVRPRDGWPNPKATAAATGASARVIERARVLARTEEAVADLAPLLATTARSRDLLLPVMGPAEAIAALRRAPRQGGLLFGPERTGLHNDDLVLAHAVVEIPLNPELSSLNLAQAVLLLAYRWFEATSQGDAPAVVVDEEDLATAGELHNFYEHLEQELDAAEFFRVREKRAGMVQNLRALFARARLRRHEVRTLHGIVATLTGRRKDGSPVREPRGPAP